MAAYRVYDEFDINQGKTDEEGNLTVLLKCQKMREEKP